MRKSKEEAAETRRRIVTAAAGEFREHGIVATGLADLMKAAGLTHGGFYKHFESKDQVVAEACAEAMSLLEKLHALPRFRGCRLTTNHYPLTVAPAAWRIATIPSCPRRVAHARGVAHGSSSGKLTGACGEQQLDHVGHVVPGGPSERARAVVIVLGGDRRSRVEQNGRTFQTMRRGRPRLSCVHRSCSGVVCSQARQVGVHAAFKQQPQHLGIGGHEKGSGTESLNRFLTPLFALAHRRGGRQHSPAAGVGRARVGSGPARASSSSPSQTRS